MEKFIKMVSQPCGYPQFSCFVLSGVDIHRVIGRVMSRVFPTVIHKSVDNLMGCSLFLYYCLSPKSI